MKLLVKNWHKFIRIKKNKLIKSEYKMRKILSNVESMCF